MVLRLLEKIKVVMKVLLDDVDCIKTATVILDRWKLMHGPCLWLVTHEFNEILFLISDQVARTFLKSMPIFLLSYSLSPSCAHFSYILWSDLM